MITEGSVENSCHEIFGRVVTGSEICAQKPNWKEIKRKNKKS